MRLAMAVRSEFSGRADRYCSPDERCRLAPGEARCVVDGHEVGEHDLVVVFEVVPGEIEQVAVLVLPRLAGDAGNSDELDGIPHLLWFHSEMVRGVLHADAFVFHEERH